MNILTNELSINILSLIFFIIVFVLLIPYILLTNGFTDILEVYLPNVDMVATILSFKGGFLPGNYFKDLYNLDPKTTMAFISQTLINYIALLGVSFIVARETFLTDNIAIGWSQSLVMFILTYLIPSKLIVNYMGKMYNYLERKFPSLDKTKTIDRFKLYFPSLLAGLVVVFTLIFTEKLILTNLRNVLINIATFIINIPNEIE